MCSQLSLLQPSPLPKKGKGKTMGLFPNRLHRELSLTLFTMIISASSERGGPDKTTSYDTREE